MSPVLWFTILLAAAAAAMVFLLLRRPDFVARVRAGGGNFSARLVPLNADRALALITREAIAVLDTKTGRTATGVNVALSRSLWDIVQKGSIVQRLRAAAAELEPPHPHGSKLLVRPVPSSKLADGTLLVTTLRNTQAGTRVLGSSDVPTSAEGTLEMIPIVEHIARFVLPPRVTLILGGQGDLVVPAQSAELYGVSTFHAALTNIDGVLEFADLDSTNGVFLNGQRVTTTGVVEAGEEFACGNARWLIAEREVGRNEGVPRARA